MPSKRCASSFILLSARSHIIVKGLELYPEGQDGVPLTLSPEAIPDVLKQLGQLGFNKVQSQDAVKFLSEDSTLTSTILSTQPPLQACIEYLILHIPECDLPERFLPSTNSSNPFITSAHSGEDDLKRRWVEDKAVKEAGWPLQAVKECTANPKYLERWDLLMATLGRKLIGLQLLDWDANPDELPYPIDSEEYEALGAHIEEPGHLVIPLFSAPIQIHILFSESEKIPRPRYFPIYITSTTAPAYIRLHLLSRLLLAMELKPDLEFGEGFCMTVMRLVEEAWAEIEDNGPPNIVSVLKNIISQPARYIAQEDDPSTDIGSGARRKRTGNQHRNDGKTDLQIKQMFEAIQRSNKVWITPNSMVLHLTEYPCQYKQVLEKRQKLPAFQAREEFLEKLENNRVVIVVGETGMPWIFPHIIRVLNKFRLWKNNPAYVTLLFTHFIVFLSS